MKFGKKLIEQASPQWADAYLPYKSLKETIKLFQGAGPATNKAEGEFLAALLNGIQTVNTFFTGQEAEYARRLESLARTLAAPKNWLLQAPIFDDDDAEPDFPSVVSMLVGGVHVPEEQREALSAFLTLCNEVDLLRKFSVCARRRAPHAFTPPQTAHARIETVRVPLCPKQVLNSLAVTKICKKHDKHSAVKLSPPILALVTSQAFYTSRTLAATFTHAQCIATEILTAVTQAKPPSIDYTCSICLELLNMPVVLSCTHRFCYGCLSEASFHNSNCPLCKKETDLDP